MRTIAYNLLDMLLKTFIGLFSITRSKLLPWIGMLQPILDFFLTDILFTHYQFSISFFQDRFFYAALFTIRETLNIHTLAKTFTQSHLKNPYNFHKALINRLFQKHIFHEFSIVSKVGRFMVFLLFQKVEDS